MKNKIFIYKWMILVCLPLFVATSCNNWLDVNPKSQIKDKELFSSETGFKEALAGVYSIMTTQRLYGRELTFGMLGMLGQEWDSSPTAYVDDKMYVYDNTTTTVRIDSIWTGMYNAVANTNKLLQEIDTKKDIFSGINYEIIKGEALALRGFLHFDLLRLFGASYEENPDKIAIPYVTAYSPQIFPQLKVKDFIELVLDDLKAAADYLQQDPILTGKNASVNDDNGYLMNRQVHLNYYAVKGLMARVYLYKKDYANAEICANEVINSGKFEWVKQQNLTNANTADLTFSTEHLFALNVVTLKKVAEAYFSSSSGNNTISLKGATLLSYYETATDYRYLYQFISGTGSSSESYYLKKYYQLSGESGTPWNPSYKNKMPLIKLAEMYFIIAECNRVNSGDVLKPLNEVRRNRGIIDLTEADQQNLDNIILSEYRKELIGEGQLFFYYKRINRSKILRSDVDVIATKAYKLPMPKAEYDNPDRVNNR